MERSAATTLDEIRGGGQQLVMVALERLADCDEAIREGRFSDALERAQELAGRLTPLAQAENYIAFFQEKYIVRGKDVQEGMLLQGWGTVTAVEREEHSPPGADPHVHVRLIFDEDEDKMVAVNGDQEIVALRPPA